MQRSGFSLQNGSAMISSLQHSQYADTKTPNQILTSYFSSSILCLNPHRGQLRAERVLSRQREGCRKTAFACQESSSPVWVERLRPHSLLCRVYPSQGHKAVRKHTAAVVIQGLVDTDVGVGNARQLPAQSNRRMHRVDTSFPGVVLACDRSQCWFVLNRPGIRQQDIAKLKLQESHSLRVLHRHRWSVIERLGEGRY